MSDLAMSRRAVTRAIVTLPAIAAAPALGATAIHTDTTLKGAWDNLMAEYLAAKHVADEYERLHFDPFYEAQRAKYGDNLAFTEDAQVEEYKSWRRLYNADEIENQFEDYADAEGDAHSSLLYASAPDLEALRWKLEQTFDGSGVQLWCDEIITTIRADIARLLPKGGVA